MKRVLLTFLLLISVIGCSKHDSNSPTKINLIISWFQGAEHAFIYRAIDKGYFKEKNIEVNVISSRGSKDVAKELDSGNADFGLISGDYLVISRHKGVPLKGLMTVYHDSPATIFSLKEKNILKPFDLVSKKVGVLIEKIFNMKREYNEKCGISKKDDSIGSRFSIPIPKGGTKKNVPPLNEMLQKYYKLRGWNNK